MTYKAEYSRKYRTSEKYRKNIAVYNATEHRLMHARLAAHQNLVRARLALLLGGVVLPVKRSCIEPLNIEQCLELLYRLDAVGRRITAKKESIADIFEGLTIKEYVRRERTAIFNAVRLEPGFEQSKPDCAAVAHGEERRSAANSATPAETKGTEHGVGNLADIGNMASELADNAALLDCIEEVAPTCAAL
jgi:hypothetical protein